MEAKATSAQMSGATRLKRVKRQVEGESDEHVTFVPEAMFVGKFER